MHEREDSRPLEQCPYRDDVVAHENPTGKWHVTMRPGDDSAHRGRDKKGYEKTTILEKDTQRDHSEGPSIDDFNKMRHLAAELRRAEERIRELEQAIRQKGVRPYGGEAPDVRARPSM